MITLDRNFARLLLEICRYTYTEAFNSEEDKSDQEDALTWINGARVPILVLLSMVRRNQSHA